MSKSEMSFFLLRGDIFDKFILFILFKTESFMFFIVGLNLLSHFFGCSLDLVNNCCVDWIIFEFVNKFLLLLLFDI